MKKLITICTVVILSVAGMANADLITFSEFPVGTLISNQYAPQGVLFSGGSVTPALPIISGDGAMPNSPILSPNPKFAGDFWMNFPTAAIAVTFDSGYWDGIGTAVVDVYDPASALLGTYTNTSTGVYQFNISSLGLIGSIYFKSYNDGGGADIDNLSITPVPIPAAVLLGILGLSAVGIKLRKFA